MELSVEDRERMKALEAGEGGPDAARQDMGEMLAQSWRWSRNCDYIFRSWRGADGAWDDGSTAVLRSEPDATYDEEVLTTYLSWRSPREGPLAGVVVHLTNIEGARIESTIIKRMVALGWGVLSVNPSATGTRHLGKMSLSGPSTGAEAAGGSQRRVAAELLAWKASAYGQYLFESTSQSAYASEAVLDDLPCIDQRTIGLPVVVVGVSNGAMLAPGVAALLGERIRAVVVIAGGGTYFDVAATSSLVRDRPSPEAYARVRDKVLGDYLALNPLDPIAAAPMISRTPVLQIVPMFDHIVPTRLQMDLWRALGRPERWDLPCGHIGTILLQSSIAKRVDGWLRDQLRVQGVARFHDDTR